MTVGGVTNPRSSLYLPPPLLVRLYAKLPPTNTERIAFGFELVASILTNRLLLTALVIRTTSAGAGAPGVMVTVVVRMMPNQLAVMVAVLVAVTGLVVTANAPRERPPGTSAVSGTCSTDGSLLDSCTTAPSGVPLNCTVPVAGLPPVMTAGVTEIDDNEAPAGGAELTEML